MVIMADATESGDIYSDFCAFTIENKLDLFLVVDENHWKVLLSTEYLAINVDLCGRYPVDKEGGTFVLPSLSIYPVVTIVV